jgi:DNA methylase
VTLQLGDGVAWLEAQPADSLDGIFSDPPWGAGPDIAGQAIWQSLLARVLWAAERVVRDDGHVHLWYGQAMLDPIFRYVIPHTCLFLNAILTVRYNPHRYMARYAVLDYVFVFGRTRHAPPRGNLYAFQEYVCNLHGKSDTDHPCPRSQETVSAILRDWYREGDVICDPFCGSDTTGWAARRLGMSCYSWEIDPVMFRYAEARHAQQDLFLDDQAGVFSPASKPAP